jgi:hypothetical protein
MQAFNAKVFVSNSPFAICNLQSTLFSLFPPVQETAVAASGSAMFVRC